MKIQNRRDTQYISINFKDLHDNLFVKKRNYPNCTIEEEKLLKILRNEIRRRISKQSIKHSFNSIYKGQVVVKTIY